MIMVMTSMVEYPTEPNDVHVGDRVTIWNGVDAISGIVKKRITQHHHFLGIKVELRDGSVGRVRSISTDVTSEKLSLEEEFWQHKNCHEGQTLEFKASFVFDQKRYYKRDEKEMFYDGPHSIAKTIAAFANSSGGILYIGVEDNREILGLEYDYELLRNNKDIKLNENDGSICFTSNGEFLFSLRSAMNSLFVDKYAYRENTCVEMFHANNKPLCVIKVNPSKRPVILSNSSGRMEFYVRHTDQSEPYQDISRFCDYWCDHIKSLKLDTSTQ